MYALYILDTMFWCSMFLQYSQRHSVINHCDRRITHLNDFDMSLVLLKISSKFLLHLECCLLSPKRHIRISQCSPFLLNDRWLFFVADFYSVFSFFCRCAQVRVITLFFQFYASTCYSNFILFSTCLSYIYIILLSLVIYLSKRDFITIFFSKVLIFLLILLLFQPGYVSF